MNFLRQKADSFLTNISRGSSEEDVLAAAAAEAEVIVKDPAMDAAIEDMKDRLAELRAETLLKRMKYEKERTQLQQSYTKATTNYNDRLNTIVATRLTDYLAATKEVRDYIVPGVVASLQAQLCLHVHGICVHSEAVVSTKSDASEIIYWYEDMIKQLRRDQADKEMELMNKLVQAKIELGSLVDSKSLRKEERTTMRTFSGDSQGSRTTKRAVEPTQKAEETQSDVGEASTTTTKTPRATSNNSSSSSESQQQQKQQRRKVQPTISSGNRQRVIRKVSRRGNAHHHHRPAVSTAAQGAATLQTLQRRTSEVVATADGMTSAATATAGRYQRRGVLPAVALSSPVISLSPEEADTITLDATNTIDEEDAAAAKAAPKASPEQTEEDSSEGIGARREARRKARETLRKDRQLGSNHGNNSPTTTVESNKNNDSSRGRPIRRGVQRTRSKSLTSKNDGKGNRRGGRKKTQQKTMSRTTSKDDSDILIASPSARRNTHELLRGFSPTPPLLASPGSSQSSMPENTTTDERGITGVFQSWMGAVSGKGESEDQNSTSKQEAPASPTRRAEWVG